MNWSITLKKFLILAVYTGAAAAVTFALQHTGELGIPAWALGFATALLSTISLAIGNAIKHLNDPPAKPATGGN